MSGQNAAPRSTLPVQERRLQPYAGQEMEPSVESVVVPAGRWEDARNVFIIVAAWVLLLILVPANRDYANLDDWIYIPNARDTLETGKFVMPDWSQANLVGMIYWGVLWCKLFGFSITTLTYSILFLYVIGIIAFYGVARLADLTPRASLLAAGLLGFNPIMVYLAYAFMTDVPFISLMMVACYFYMRGLKSAGVGWMLVGGLVAGWAYLMRQFAVLIPVGLVGYLIFEGLVQRKLRWRHIFVTSIIPLHFVVGWAFWTHDWPQTWASGSAGSRTADIVMKPWWPRVIWIRHLLYLPFVALFAWTAVKMRRSRWWLVAAWLAIIVWSMYNLTLLPETGTWQVEPPFTAQIGPLSFPLPQETFTFGVVGSLFRLNGIDFEEYYYPQQKVWTEEAWRAIWVLGVVLGAVLMAKVTSGIFDWLRTIWRKERSEALSPVTAFYFVGAIMAFVSIAFPGDPFPRYALGYTPFVILFMVRGAKQWGRVAWGYSIVALALLAAFSVLARADYADHMKVRYYAAMWMEARTGQVRAGWNWNHWGHPDSETYVVSDILEGQNFGVVKLFPYTCRLCGFSTRYVLAQARLDMPPVPSEPLPGLSTGRIGPPPR